MADPERPESPSRRRFFWALAALTNGLFALAFVPPVLGFLAHPFLRRRSEGAWLAVSPADSFEPGATPRGVRVRRMEVDGYLSREVVETVWVIRGSDDSEVRAFSGACTHLGCSVAWSLARGRFECPCHGGAFSREGAVLGGPPRKPLERYETRVRDGVLEVRRTNPA